MCWEWCKGLYQLWIVCKTMWIRVIRCNHRDCLPLKKKHTHSFTQSIFCVLKCERLWVLDRSVKCVVANELMTSLPHKQRQWPAQPRAAATTHTAHLRSSSSLASCVAPLHANTNTKASCKPNRLAEDRTNNYIYTVPSTCTLCTVIAHGSLTACAVCECARRPRNLIASLACARAQCVVVVLLPAARAWN